MKVLVRGLISSSTRSRQRIESFRTLAQGYHHATVAPRATHSLGSAWLGAALVALGMVANALATFRYATVRRAIERGDVGAPSATLVYVMGTTASLVGDSGVSIG